jgi:uncharacterized protein involved in exopolysaccharide biosynthesis
MPDTSHLTQRGTPLAAPAAGDPARDDELSLVGVLNVLLAHRTLILGLSLLFAVPTAILTYLKPRTYSSTASFMPQSRRQVSAVTGLAAQFGLTAPGGDPGQNPAFYAELLKSAEILGPAVDGEYEVRSGRGRIKRSLVDIYKSAYRIDEPTPALQRAAAIAHLGRNLSAGTTKTGLVRVTVTAADASLAQQINVHLLELLNRFNLESRRGQAAAERRFVEKRLQEVRRDLRDAEDRLQVFLQRNRTYSQSPELTFQQERLTREVTLQQGLHTTLAESYEQAKIEEVRDTPLISTVEKPVLPLRPNSRGMLRRTAIALVWGALLGSLLAFLREYTRGAGFEQKAKMAEFSTLRAEAIDDLRHPWRPVLRMLGRPRDSAPRRPEPLH